MEKSPMQVYIVENDAIWASFLKGLLERSGYEVVGTATSYRQAVRDLNLNKVDLLLLDIQLEGEETGIDLAGYINQYLSIPFIFQSSETDVVVLQKAINTYPLDFLIKPFRKEKLLDALYAAHGIIDYKRQYQVQNLVAV
ncbi:response regulator receiver domain-containing protein [Arcticibacter tournemirensis]|uniref:Response regulator n=1 Tax=Arcticibacter tournemirensis TaxID=699437 RepID=A0A5M9HFC7_9SPHI|nr:response regulator [Arcticibacter tournemirensis]KAA8483607.1 response regulator [Arcticibacter tournemirensis]TQM51440.1 response regulator receiver domain-containing protein [Arcticibacter tournemirensis]